MKEKVHRKQYLVWYEQSRQWFICSWNEYKRRFEVADSFPVLLLGEECYYEEFKEFPPSGSLRISDVIKKLERIKEKEGDLEVASTNYHSDGYDVLLTHEKIEDQIEVIIGTGDIHSATKEKIIPYVMIYGGSS